MITDKSCTGCSVCAAVCPKCCIQMRPNRLGRLVPVIDKKKCVHCGLCEKTCPQNHPPATVRPQACFVAWSKDSQDLIHSASGGIGVSFARWMLDNGGAVYGCDYTPEGDLHHFRLSDAGDLERIRGSKYSHSNAAGCFPEIRQLLKAHTPVLFTGTPCQVAGLRSYLSKDYPELVTVDLVCHGTPPTVYLQEHLKDLGIPFPVDRIVFRGEYDQMLTVRKDDQILYRNKWQDDTYYTAFYANAISYGSCYTCQYAKGDRCSDITIGDFWGLGKLENIHPGSKRPSLILVNSEKGQRFFDSVSQSLLYEERPVNEGIRGNGRLLHPPGKSRRAQLFELLYKSGFGFHRAVKISGRMESTVHRIRKFMCRDRQN